LHNCVPGDAIGDRLAEFGGGVLMSATLAPLDVFAEVTGLRHLEREAGRPISERTYGLHFPVENRESFAVAAPKFTYDNRGPPASRMVDGDPGGGDERTPGEENETRRVYADAIRHVAGSPGNVLVGMPSYSEAEWAAAVLRESDVGKRVLLDESSADDVTEDLKAEFFDGDPKVLVTSLRGTLTEGVDYRGDRLRAAIVCGVPIVNTASPRTRAVRTAYDEEFGDGFEYALTIPAVRKARQAVGRVIRGPHEVGVRVLVDERYARDGWDSVREYVPESESFQAVSPDMLSLGLDRFWDDRG
ncbi:MAG: helicase C-terminal domain-containing protein, partial [Halolamina sp.]